MASPIVLIVDDEPTFGIRLKEAFILSPMWGSLFIDDLSYALSVLENDTNNIKVLLVDWGFSKGYSVKQGLYDGIDLIRRVQAIRPDVHCFLMTAQNTSKTYQRKVNGLSGATVLFKQDFELSLTTLKARGLAFPGLDPSSTQPWDVIASNVVRLPISGQRPSNEARADTYHTGNEEAARKTVTYVQELNGHLLVRKPIKIQVERLQEAESDVYRASAPSLGLLVAGYGDDPLDAIHELQIVIADHFENLEDRRDLEGMAKYTQELLMQHVERRGTRGTRGFNYGQTS